LASYRDNNIRSWHAHAGSSQEFRLRTFRAAAASCKMHLEIFLAVIVGKFFAGLDVAERENKYTTLEDIDLAIWRARMVDEAGGIRRYVPVHHAGLACPKKVLPAILLYLLGCGWASEVFDDA
jgi:hypothetical protein